MTVSELADMINGVKFYGLLGAFCLSLTVIGILIGYIIMIRYVFLFLIICLLFTFMSEMIFFTHYEIHTALYNGFLVRKRQLTQHQGSRDIHLPDVSRDYVNCESYEELHVREVRRSEIYDTVQ